MISVAQGLLGLVFAAAPRGVIALGYRSILACYELNPSARRANVDHGWTGMDTNGDGWIDERANSNELTFANDESVMFDVGGRSLSPVSLDLEKGVFIIREHPEGSGSRIPLREKAYRQFRDRGFVALGMNDDRDTQPTRAVLREKGVTFPQSTGDLGNQLVYQRFRVDRFPTAVLVDPNGKIIGVDLDDQLRGENLAKTLDRILPRPR